MRVAIYCRVSTEDQEREGTSLQTQLEACLAYCHQKDYQIARRFCETYSGLTLERPKLNELRDLIRTNDIDAVVVYCLDRLSRDPTHGVILTQELEKHNVTLEAVIETVESTELGKLINYIRGYASMVEAEKIKERTMRGKLARLKEGKLPQGTGIGIYGYEWDKTTGRRTVADCEAKVFQKIFTMVLQGFSFRKVALELNKAHIKSKSGPNWYPFTIRRIVTNEAYMGKTYFHKTKRTAKTKVTSRPREDWILLPDVTPPIVTEEIFNRTQELLRQGKQARPIKQSSPYLLVGFIKCSKCGSPICGTTMNRKYRYYQCTGARPTTTRGKICDAAYIRANELENSVWHKVLEMLSSPLTLLSLFTDAGHVDRKRRQQDSTLALINKQIHQLRRKLKAYPAKERNLYDLLSYETVTKDYVLDAVNKLKQEQSNDEAQLGRLLATRKQISKSENFTFKLTEFSEQLRAGALYVQQDTSNPTDHLDQKRKLFETLRLQVLATPQNYQLTFKLGAQIVSSSDADFEDHFNQLLKEFEQQHPDINMQDLLDIGTQLPEDTSFGRAVNTVKQNLVATEQTSRCS